MCNFMSLCSQNVGSTIIISHDSVTNAAITSLNIIGSRSRTMLTSQELYLEGNATIKSCNGHLINTDFFYLPVLEAEMITEIILML